MTPLPRARCPVCGANVAVRRGGELREHRDHRDPLHGTGGGPSGTYVVPLCPASGSKP